MRTAPLEVKTDATPVPTKLLQLHQEVALEGDIYFINNQPFISTISRKIHLETVDHPVDRKADTLVSSLADVINLCNNRGFKVTTMIMNPEFTKTSSQLLDLGVELQPVGPSCHAPLIERSIRTQKERI